MYERAWAAEPQNEEFGTHVFNGLIRDFNFPKQQQVHTPNSRYTHRTAGTELLHTVQREGGSVRPVMTAIQ